MADSGYCLAHPTLGGLQYSVPAADDGSVTVRIIGRRVDLTVRTNPLMSTPPLQEGLPSGGRRASTNQMQASSGVEGSGMNRKKNTNERIIPNQLATAR